MRWLILLPILFLVLACSPIPRGVKRAQDCMNCGPDMVSLDLPDVDLEGEQ